MTGVSDCVAKLPHRPACVYLKTRIGGHYRACDLKPSASRRALKRVRKFTRCGANRIGALPSILRKRNERTPFIMLDARQCSVGTQKTLRSELICLEYAVMPVIQSCNQPVCSGE